MNGITASTAPWYASRATGVVALLLLTGVMVLGMLVNRQGRLPGLPGFAVTNLHRNISLLAVSFVAVHVVTAVLDTFVSIPIVAAVIPFTSSYEGLTLSLGAVAFDLMLALIVSSLVRSYLSRRLWRAVHLLAYMSWPVAFLHGIAASPDLQHGALLLLALCCALAVGAALIWRLAAAARELPRAERVGALMSAFGRRHAGAGRGDRRGAGPRNPTAVS